MESEFTNKNTDQLSDLYGEWLVENGFEGDEPADDLLRAGTITNRQREWLEDFCRAFKDREEYEDKAVKAWPDPIDRNCNVIADRWVAKFGLGFHPDTRGADYEPPLSPDEVVEYEAGMDYLFAHAGDPYAVGLAAMERAGLC